MGARGRACVRERRGTRVRERGWVRPESCPSQARPTRSVRPGPTEPVGLGPTSYSGLVPKEKSFKRIKQVY
jgi:hypothetical protein